MRFGLSASAETTDEIQKRVGAVNRALYTLFNFWNILEQFRKEVIEPFRGKPDAWLNLLATVPSKYGLTAFEAVRGRVSSANQKRHGVRGIAA